MEWEFFFKGENLFYLEDYIQNYYFLNDVLMFV